MERSTRPKGEEGTEVRDCKERNGRAAVGIGNVFSSLIHSVARNLETLGYFFYVKLFLFLLPGENRNTLQIILRWLFFYLLHFVYLSILLYYFRSIPVAVCDPLTLASSDEEIQVEGMAFQAIEPEYSDSSVVSFNTFRDQFNEGPVAELIERIEQLEKGGFYNIPPQNRPGEYAQVIQELLAQSLDREHFLSIYNREESEIQIFERLGEIENRLVALIVTEEKIDKIQDLSPYTNFRQAASDFLKENFKEITDLQYPEEHEQMEETLKSLVRHLRLRHKNAKIYKAFYSFFLDEASLRMRGIDLP